MELSDKPLIAKEIWETADNYSIEKPEIKSSNQIDTLNASIYQYVQKGEESSFYIASRRPACYGLKSKRDSYTDDSIVDVVEEITEASTKTKKSASVREEYHERALHKLLVSFVRTEPFFGVCYTKTIFHEESTNKQAKEQAWHSDESQAVVAHPARIAIHVQGRV